MFTIIGGLLTICHLSYSRLIIQSILIYYGAAMDLSSVNIIGV